jgi:predicted ATPase/class 3 adenylate cyclase
VKLLSAHLWACCSTSSERLDRFLTMGAPPSGTITFLFTDIEGSTRLWDKQPEKMKAAMQRHHTILKNAINAQDGYIFQIVGDAFFASFQEAGHALDAAVEAQRALQKEKWDLPFPLLVRMGLHSGSVEVLTPDNPAGAYASGPTLNRTSRVVSAAHGGQVLLTQATYELVRDHKSGELSLHDLGERRLRDLIHPEHLYQLSSPGLRAEFPPIKTLDIRPNNLPYQLTGFIGRKTEITEIIHILGGARELTLTGTGGAGKTRLALQIAAELSDDFADGVWFIDLAPISDPSLVVQAIATILGIREHPQQLLADTLISDLHDQELLMILDNCEHLVDASARVTASLLRSAPGIKIIATSREALHIDGENTYHVPSLRVPDLADLPPLETLTEYEAVRLFIERAQAALSSFKATHQNAMSIAQVCTRLDGIPLAIELAAARVKLLKVEQIAARLDDCFQLLTGGNRTALPRQQTLKALIDWSWELLAEDEQKLLSRLSVFVGGCTFESIEAVCSGDGVDSARILDLLSQLVNKSLLVAEREQGQEARLRLLETIRQFAREKLKGPGDGDWVRSAHADYFLKLAEAADREHFRGSEQLTWLNRFETEHDNLRTALEWFQNSAGGIASGLRLAAVLGQFWTSRGYLREGRERLSNILSLPGVQQQTLARAEALAASAELAYRQSDYLVSKGLFEESLAICRKRGEKRDIAIALNGLGNIATDMGDYGSAPALFEQALALWREINNVQGIARALINLGWAALRPGDNTQAELHLKEALTLYQKAGDETGTAMALSGLGEVAVRRGEYQKATELLQESLKFRRELGDKWGIAVSLGSLGWVALAEHELPHATLVLGESLSIRREIGDKGGSAWCLERLAEVARERGLIDPAVRVFGAAAALRSSIGSVIDPVDQPKIDQALAAMRTQLGGADFESAWSEGQKMTLDELIQIALNPNVARGQNG